MKPRRRPRTFIEIIPERKGFIYDRARDIYVKMPIMTLTRKQRESIGELAKLTVTDGDPSHPRLLDLIIEFLSRHREAILMVKACFQARNFFAILVTYGYPYQQPVECLDGALNLFAGLFRREIVRRFLSNRIDGADEGECLLFLSSQIEAGQWPNWLEEIREIEAALCV
jgi:hypothetical protein